MRFSDLFWRSPCQSREPAYTFVSKINRLDKHHRTAARYDLDIIFTREGYGFFGNTTLTEGTVQPDMVHAELDTFSHHLIANIGVCGDDHTLHPTRDRLQIRVTSVPFDHFSVGIRRVDLITSIQHEARIRPTSPFFINLSREVGRTYEELRTKKIRTEEVAGRLLKFSQNIVEWKREEEEIGRDRYPVFEAVKSVLPEVAKQRALDFTSKLTVHLEKEKLLFKDWQMQREVRRKVKTETRLMLLSEFKDHRNKIDDLADRIFTALEVAKR